VQNTVARLLLGAAGAFFLLRLAWTALRDARTGHVPRASPITSRGDFAAGAVVSLTNPNAVAFWLGIGGGIVAAGMSDPGPRDFAVFFIGFMLGATLWCFFISGLIAWGRQWMTASYYRWVNLGCALALAYFGLRLCVDTIGLL
jgi:threonine/homoserine/homoserine lactone efflux protein